MSKAKKITYVLIRPEESMAMFEMLARVREQAHEDLAPAKIALAWCTSWNEDVDGRVTLGKCRRASDLDRELHPYDFVILLNYEWWQHEQVTDHQREALLDHELSHAAPKLDQHGHQVEDEKDRKVWRTRKHDIEEFSGVVQRRGVYKRDLESFAQALHIGRMTNGQKSILERVDEINENATDDAAQRLAADPKFRRALENIRPKPGSGIDKVSISADDHGVTLHASGKTEVH
jgi:hypothetical protein